MEDFKNGYNEGMTRDIEDSDVDLLEHDFTETIYKKTEPEVYGFDAEGNSKKEDATPEQENTGSSENKNENTENKKSGYNATSKDYQVVAKFIIEFADAGMSNILKFIAKEDSAKQFELKADKKFHLTGLLSEILLKHQIKLSIELLFLIVLGGYYAPAIKEAISLRKENDKKKSEKDKYSQHQQASQAQQNSKKEEHVKNEEIIHNKYNRVMEVVQEDIKVNEPEYVQTTNVEFEEPKKKKRGRPSEKKKADDFEDALELKVDFKDEGIDRDNI